MQSGNVHLPHFCSKIQERHHIIYACVFLIFCWKYDLPTSQNCVVIVLVYSIKHFALGCGVWSTQQHLRDTQDRGVMWAVLSVLIVYQWRWPLVRQEPQWQPVCTWVVFCVLLNFLPVNVTANRVWATIWQQECTCQLQACIRATEGEDEEPEKVIKSAWCCPWAVCSGVETMLSSSRGTMQLTLLPGTTSCQSPRKPATDCVMPASKVTHKHHQCGKTDTTPGVCMLLWIYSGLWTRFFVLLLLGQLVGLFKKSIMFWEPVWIVMCAAYCW